MKIFKRKPKVIDEIRSVLENMKETPQDSEEYARMAKNLETLCSANEKNSKNKVSLVGPLLTVAGSLIGIVMIIYGEETRIITSKALGLLVKGRV